MEEQGLAQAGVAPMPMGVSREQRQQMVAEVIKLLQQGVSPEELLQKGVPEDIIRDAIAMLQNQVNGGLAAAGTAPGAMA